MLPESFHPTRAVLSRAIKDNKLKLIAYLIVTLGCALFLSAVFGQHYDGLKAQKRGSIRQSRQASSEPSTKDPFASRPRIQTRNGHLIIEASQDKNIDFKTSGSRGSITINGYRLEGLLNVTKALERSAQLIRPARGQSSSLTDGPYDLVLKGLFESSERFAVLEKKLDSLNDLMEKMRKKSRRLEQRVTKRVSKLMDKYNSLVESLKRNDCFDLETGQPVCKNGATCLNTFNGFKCICPSNFEGPTCELDVDECAKFRNTDLGCQNNAKCVNLPGSYRCECTSQFHGIHCTEQHDDCALSSSRSLCGFGKCINLARNVANQPRYECICDQGWTTDGSNPACLIDINECLVGQAASGQLSSLNASSSSLISAAWSNSLMAAYPCSQNPFVDCINLPGSFQCGPCPPGHTGNGRVCRDLNECALNNGGCSIMPLVECINLAGSRRCGPCPPGYSGDGITCTRETACTGQPNGGCHPMARCIELEGVSLSSRLCVCKYPFVGEGVGLEGCQPLSSGSPVPVVPNYNQNTSIDVQRAPETDCSPSPCLNMAPCQLTDSSFECLCPAGFQGRICDEQVPVCGGKFYFSKGSMSFPLGGSFNELVKLNLGTLVYDTPISAPLIDRHYNCNWSITVASNMSIELIFSELANKLNPAKQVQLFLANTTIARQLVAPPTCAEYLDVSERLEAPASSITEAVRLPATTNKLLARFCTDSRTSSRGMMALASKHQVSLISESNMVELEYSFSAARNQFGEPSLGFALNWTKIEPPCGGQLQVSDSGSLSSPGFPEFYPAGSECRYLIRVPPGKRIRIQFGELNLLIARPQSSVCADSLTILDGSIGSDRAVIFRHCANNSTASFASRLQSPSSPIVSSSSTVELILDSRADSMTPLMKPRQQRGFYLTYSSEPALPGCGGLYTLKSGTIKSADYEPGDQQTLDRNSRLAVQMAGYLESPEQPGSSSTASTQNGGPRTVLQSLMGNLFKEDLQVELGFNSSRLAKLYKTRCEYEIRPADQVRNNKISLDWIELPAVPSPMAMGLPQTKAELFSIMLEPISSSSRRSSSQSYGDQQLFPSKWSLLERCAKGRLTVFDGGNPSDESSGRTEIASFCAGDFYNSSLQTAMKPVISSGHVLYLVYESSINSSDPDAPSGPNGFRLHYSTICHAIYNQQSGHILVELDSETPECIHHIVLPPNNTISLVIGPKSSSDPTNLLAPDGTCSAQAIFLDGSMQWNSSRLALLSAERQLKSFRFSGDRTYQNAVGTGNQASRVGNSPDATSPDATDASSSAWPSFADNSQDFYWQYSSSHVHDIKEFEVCRLPALSFDSIWNHLSLLFQLKKQTDNNDVEKTNSPRPKVQLTVRYQAEPSCGGIITESPGSIKLDQSRRITSLNSFPITAEQYERLHKQQFVNPCAWVLQSPPNKAVKLKFEAPVAEINKRYSDWLSWSQRIAKQSSFAPPEFSCNQVFQESVELYEPTLNRSRHLCPTEFVELNQTKLTWNTQSNTVFIRLHNITVETNTSAGYNASSVNSSNFVWPGRKPLSGAPIIVKYKFVSSLGAQCGGRLLRDSGTIRSPRFPYNYPPRLNCIWIIRTNPKQQVRLNFTKFELENPSSGGCIYDYLELRNGPAADSPLIGRFCASDLQSKVILAHSNMMWINFKTDPNFSKAGFEIQFDGAQTGCGGRLTSASGQIDSPNYPFPYGHASECEWSIEVGQSNRVELTVVDLDLSSQSTNCSSRRVQADYLELIDSENKDSSGRSLGRYCHKSQLAAINKTTIISRANKLYIVYKSQALDNSRGFRLTYRTNCAQIELNGLRGAIETPGYPGPYISGSNCSWFIRAPLGSNLTLAISDLELEDLQSYQTELSANSISGKEASSSDKCREDIAEIWALYWPQNSTDPSRLATTSNNSSQQFKLEFQARSGGQRKLSESSSLRLREPRNGKLMQTLCGELGTLPEANRSIEMNTNLAYIGFETDRYVEKRGFRIEWQARGCGGQQVGDSIQTVTYHELTNSQRPIECVWTFDMFKSAMTIEFSIHSDLRSPDASSGNNKLDPCEDASLTIYDGPTDQAPVLSRNCDSLKVRESVITSSGQALVKFFTSGRRNYGRGFVLNGWPSNREGCLPSVFDINTDYNLQAGWRKSPNYPDLYNSNEYRCYGILTAARGRLRIRIEELNIPADGKEDSEEGSGGTSGLLGPDSCRKSGNYLLVKNMNGDSVNELFCGKLNPDSPVDMKRATVVLEQETAWTEFLSKNGARGRWKFTYDRLCGSIVHADFPIELSSPNYPGRPKWPRSSRNKLEPDLYDDLDHSENVCIWRIKNSLLMRKSDSEKKLHLNIINFIESVSITGKSSDCLRIFEGVDLNIRESHFNLTAIDLLYEPKVKICKQSDIKHNSMSFISKGSEIVVMITGGAIAKFRVRPFENYCGGEFHLNRAEFASLDYPQPYTADLDCHYFIMSSPGARINLNFLAFDLPEGESAIAGDDRDTDDYGVASQTVTSNKNTITCDNVDHVEIWQLPVAQKIRAKLDLLAKLVASFARWSEASFLVWNEQHSANISDITSAIIKQPSNITSQNSPANSSSINGTSETLQTKSVVQSNYSTRLYQLAKVYHLYHETKYRSSDFQERSGLTLSTFYENARLIGRFCGKKAPIIARSADRQLRDDVLIRFRSHSPPSSASLAGSKQPRGFLAEYKLEYGGLIQLDTTGEVVQEGFIGSPMYPAYHLYNNSIRWNFETKLDSIMQFDLIDLDLGSVHRECQDTLSIFDGLNPLTSLKLTEWCGHLSFKVLDKKRRFDFTPAGNAANLPIFRAFSEKVQSSLIRTVQTSSNIASIIYNNFRSESLFLLRYKAFKKSSLTSNNKTTNNDDSNYLLNETPLESDELLRQANDNSVYGEAKNGSKICSHTHRLSFGPDKNSSQVVLMSPNWPKVGPQNIECHWLIYTYENSDIKLAVDPTSTYLADTSTNDDQYSWTRQRSPEHCFEQPNEPRDFITVHDGASPLAPVIARHCLPMAPVQLQSSGRHLLVRYIRSGNTSLPADANQKLNAPTGDEPQTSPSVTRSTLAGLFKGVASIGGCGGQYHILSSARIRDRPTKEGFYANDLSCVYYLFAANQDRVLMIINQMSDFELANEPTNSDCSIGDYIEIRDLPILNDQMDFSRALNGRSLGRFCAGRKLEHIESPGSGISIEFRTDSKNSAKGWDLYVMSSIPKVNCPRGFILADLDEPFGRFTSPNWPHGFTGKRHCKYHLVAPLNQTIKVTFVRLQRPLLLANKDEDGQQIVAAGTAGKCADNFHYLDDNEARALRYDSRPLRELQSPMSGSLLQQLVKEVPCSRTSASNGTLNSGPYSGQPAVEPSDLSMLYGLTSDNSLTGIKKIRAEEYWPLFAAAPGNAFSIETNSHVLLLDYDTKNLLPREGFVAIYRTAEKKTPCGGEITYEPIDLSDSAIRQVATRKRSNLIESANFGLETLKTDDYIQCEWSIKGDQMPNLYDDIDSPQVISYKMTPTAQLGTFKTAYIVFQVLEIPPTLENSTIFDDNFSRTKLSKLNEICGLNRLYMADRYLIQITFACGNLTDKKLWTLIDYSAGQISLRTKNLKRSAQPQIAPANGAQLPSPPVVFRGLRAYYYEKSCLQIEHVIGEGIRIRSHGQFPNSSYWPGICRWEVMLRGGDYELSFDKIQFRAPENQFVNETSRKTSQQLTGCNTNDPDLDYIELRASMDQDSPILARYCFHNQATAKQKALMLNMKTRLVVLFVAGMGKLQYGIERFSFNKLANSDIGADPAADPKQEASVSGNYGFDLLIVRVKNESLNEFCQQTRRQSVYSFIGNPEHEYFEGLVSSLQRGNFLYPKNTHCVVELDLEQGMQFNMSFKGLFDLEQTRDCQNDYVQLDDLLEPTEVVGQPNKGNSSPGKQQQPIGNRKSSVSTTRKPRLTSVAPNSKAPTDDRLQLAFNKRELIANKIGRWCGKSKPAGYFVSKTNKVRLTFHSNERIEGKGFYLEYSRVKTAAQPLSDGLGLESLS